MQSNQPAPASLSIQSSGISQATSHKLQALLAGPLARKDIHHAILGIEAADRSWHWYAAGGQANPAGREMTVDTPFFIASVDKLFTAVATLLFHEKGMLNLDSPISSCLPRSITQGLHRYRDVDYSDRVTVRHLLSHSSGLADYLEDRLKSGRSLIEELVEQGDRHLELEEVAEIIRGQLSPHFPPQDLNNARVKIRYCDSNYFLLIAILERVSGKSLPALFRELFFEPFGLENTFFDDPAQPHPRMAAVASLWFGDQAVQIPHILRDLRSIYSTLADTIAFLRALVKGQVFDQPATLAAMQCWNRFGFPFDMAALRAPSWPIQYGLGMMRYQVPRLLSPAYSMPALVGHSGSTGTWLFYCQKLDLFLSGAVNQGTAGPIPFRLLPQVLRVLETDVNRS